MAIDFYMSNNIDEIKENDKFISMEENIHSKLYRIYKNNELGEGIKLLAELDPYRDKTFEIEELKIIIEGIQKEIPLNEIYIYVVNFLKAFIKFSEEAIEKNIKIIAIGD